MQVDTRQVPIIGIKTIVIQSIQRNKKGEQVGTFMLNSMCRCVTFELNYVQNHYIRKNILNEAV